ncbi:MAG: GTPase Era [Pelotomaculum sp. PtaU1.Bin035]|nr:MAG: GTPase Era [Pelotomaculum sp. PtaU1.Bin035]
MSKLQIFVAKSEELKDLAGPGTKPAVAILGSFNSGKSTLLNCLLGEEISPVGAVPTTGRLLYFDYGDSFCAKYAGIRDKWIFNDRVSFNSFLAGQRNPGGRVNIEIPSPILKKCRLIDTPGIDFQSHEAIRLAEQAAKEADKVIYLFHQRGMENFNRVFLYKFASIWKGKNLNDISFWLNCNLGDCDGTSLETTRAALREIFLSRVRLNAINTFNQENIKAIRLYLEVELAKRHFDNLAQKLIKIDSEIPARLKKIIEITDESLFLSEFWKVFETAERLHSVNNSIKSIPLIIGETEELLNTINSSNLLKAENRPGGQLYRPRAAGLKEGRELILGLIGYLMREKQLDGLLDRAGLRKLAGEIAGERFTIVAAGSFSTGKSTFFNALLKEEILPTGNGPTTSALTRISYGEHKMATVHIPLQVTMRIVESAGGNNLLCRYELDTLEKWLANNEREIAYLEACVDGRFKQVDRREMAALAELTKEFFAAGAFARAAGIHRTPAVFKPVPTKGTAGKKVLQKVRLTFQYPDAPEFDLSNPAYIKKFRETTGSENVFRVAGINISHPSEFLKLVDFIDTPGLDSIQKHYFADISDCIRQSDACLVFLNGRHILNDMDRENLQAVFLPQINASFKRLEMTEKESAKFFFVVNFADVLTTSQKEAVVNFVRKNLSRTTSPGARVFPDPKIFLISALSGLAGKDRGMEILLKSLEEEIMRYRGKDFYRNKLNELHAELEGLSQKINIELFEKGQGFSERKKSLRRALGILRESRREIKNIKKTIYSPGRL